MSAYRLFGEVNTIFLFNLNPRLMFPTHYLPARVLWLRSLIYPIYFIFEHNLFSLVKASQVNTWVDAD